MKIKHKCIYCKKNIFYTRFNGKCRTCSTYCARKWNGELLMAIRLKNINTNQLRKYLSPERT